MVNRYMLYYILLIVALLVLQICISMFIQGAGLAAASVFLLMVFCLVHKWFTERQLKMLSEKLKEVTKTGVLSKIDLKCSGETEVLMKEINMLLSQMLGVLGKFTASAEKLGLYGEHLSADTESAGTTAGDISEVISEIAAGSGRQSEALIEIKTNTKSVQDEARAIFNHCQESSGIAGEMKSSMEESGRVFKSLKSRIESSSDLTFEMSEKIKGLEKMVNDVGSITGTVEAISEQTNLLALNAAIEAARAGEQEEGLLLLPMR